ncbi:MAG TPA: adenylate/guanylate cyclase domain-containing protein [Lachnospiraceae bacterium]|nr:adenylate/guanylate cyclase domain-containing protein [Lachnospiraceae bacterium]
MSDALKNYEYIVKDMSEGVITFGADGVTTLINDACKKILCVDDSIVGVSFAKAFFGREENDAFNQTILNAIYDHATTQSSIVDYAVGEQIKKLYVTTSYLKETGLKENETQSGNNGIVVVINDLSELYELKDAVRAMEQIKALNGQLQLRNQLISETFGRYLSDEIVEKLLNSPDGCKLGGEKKELTILMSDIRGFTAMSEIMSPVDLMSMLNHYLTVMTELIQNYKGTIIEFIGDAIFAIFGEPIECENGAENAVKCAVEMQNAMEAVNVFNEEQGYPHLEMGIGINTGEVILGNIGSEKRAKYGVVGQNVNLAGRIEGYTVGGQVLASESTTKKIEKLTYRSRHEIYPKGIKTPINVYDIASVGELVCHTETDEFVSIEPAERIEIHVFDGKYAREEVVECYIIAKSEKRMRLDTKMELYTNVKFEYNGTELMGKFIENDVIQIVRL